MTNIIQKYWNSLQNPFQFSPLLFLAFLIWRLYASLRNKWLKDSISVKCSWLQSQSPQQSCDLFFPYVFTSALSSSLLDADCSELFAVPFLTLYCVEFIIYKLDTNMGYGLMDFLTFSKSISFSNVSKNASFGERALLSVFSIAMTLFCSKHFATILYKIRLYLIRTNRRLLSFDRMKETLKKGIWPPVASSFHFKNDILTKLIRLDWIWLICEAI